MSAGRLLAAMFLAAVAVLVTPDVAEACPMCFSGPVESRRAFFVTAAFLTLLPLGMVAGATAWLRGKARAAEAAEAGGDSEQASSGS